MTHQKRLSAPKHYPIERKHYSYVSGIKGSRSSGSAIPAVLFLRDVTGYAESEKEAKQIIRDGQLLRNGERVRDVKEGIGVLDVVTLKEVDEAYRVIIEGDNLRFIEVDDSDKTIARIEEKSTEGDEFVYHLLNGDNYRSEESFETGSSLLLNREVEEVKREEGAQVLVISGKHAGEVAELKDIQRRNLDRDTGTVESEYEFSTQLENLVAVKDIQLGDE
jgi:small subunit ribosomal protein S4e